jgi:hypothetical protein
VPATPQYVESEVLMKDLSIKISFRPPISNQGSEILRYRLYQSRDQQMSQKTLVYDLPVGDFETSLKDVNSLLSFDIGEPLLAVSYYFQVAAVNAMGEGALSKATNETIIGIYYFNYAQIFFQINQWLQSLSVYQIHRSQSYRKLKIVAELRYIHTLLICTWSSLTIIILMKQKL